MTGVETHYRMIALAERMDRIAQDMEQIEGNLMDSAQLFYMHQAIALAEELRGKLRAVPIADRDLRSMLSASIESVQHRRRCREIEEAGEFVPHCSEEEFNASFARYDE